MPFRRVSLPRSIFRVCWGPDPLAFAPLSLLVAGKPGRWDDPAYRFRTVYYANSFLSAFIEVLSPLRPDPQTVATLRSLGVPLPNMEQAIAEYLEHRSAALVFTQQDQIVDIVHAASRTEFEVLTHRRKRLKAGDFLARDLRVPRRAAGILYDCDEVGIRAPTAEGLRVGETFALFEEVAGAGKARAALKAGKMVPAADLASELAEARNFLEI